MRALVDRQSDVDRGLRHDCCLPGLLGDTDGVAEAIKHYNDLVVPAGYASLTVRGGTATFSTT